MISVLKIYNDAWHDLLSRGRTSDPQYTQLEEIDGRFGRRRCVATSEWHAGRGSGRCGKRVQGSKRNGYGRRQDVRAGLRIFPLYQDGVEIVGAAVLTVEALRLHRRVEAVLVGMDELAVEADETGNHEHVSMFGVLVDVDAADGKQVPDRQQDCSQDARKPGCMTLLLIHFHKDSTNNV